MKKIREFVVMGSIAMLLISCSTSQPSGNTINPGGNTIQENVLYEDVVFEDEIVENQLYEIYLQEKLMVENVIKEALQEEDLIEEVYLLETFYIPADDPYRYYDGAAGMAVFGDNLDINSLIIKGAIGAGCILTIAVISILSFTSPVSVAVITLAKNALPYAIKGAAVGTIMGAGIGATLGTTDAIDSSGRITALTTLALSTAALIVAIVTFPVGGAALALAVGITAIVGSSLGLVVSGVETYKAFTRTDKIDVNLENLNWDKLGYTIAEKAIGGAANGFVVGAVSGAVLGVAKSFQKVNGKMVLLDNSTFDPNYVDSLGRTNIERMEAGLAPIGKDGYPVNIHHLDQTNNGAVVEMQQTVHRSNYFTIHSNTGQYPSNIDRPEFNAWRVLYWIWRATNFI